MEKGGSKTSHPVQESSLGNEDGAWGGSENGSSRTSLHSGSYGDEQSFPKANSGIGSAGDSGYLSQSTGSLQSPVENLCNSVQTALKVSCEMDTENCYKMNHPRRGQCVIVNNTIFQKETMMGDRPGSDLDAKNMERVFKKLGFEVNVHHNKTTIQMLQLVDHISKQNHSDCDCLAMVILSHGDAGVIFGTNGFIRFEQLTAPLKGNGCKSLIGKPKLFFIQACRGTELDEGVEVPDAAPDDNDKKKQSLSKIPVEADFLYAFSSPEGHYSFRNNAKGAWFIQAITRVFEEHGTEKEIMQLLTRANRIVAQEFESQSRNKVHAGKKQVPSIVSTLTKELYFIKK